MGPLGVEDPADPGLVLQPHELCSDHSEHHIATFEDADLEAVVMGALGIGAPEDLTCGLVSELAVLAGPDGAFTDMAVGSLVGIQNLTGLTSLTLSEHSISDLSPLSGLTSLTHLDLWVNSITDISALSGLTNLKELVLGSNSITDIGALSGLTSLTVLRLFNNSISDISGLSGLTGLTYLDTRLNSISDISGLSGLTSLTVLTLYSNSISDISALSGLTNLMVLTLYNNSISDINALSGLTGLGDVDGPYYRPGPALNLSNNPNLTNIQPLLAKHRARSGRFGRSQEHQRELRGRRCAGSQRSDGGVRLFVTLKLK